MRKHPSILLFIATISFSLIGNLAPAQTFETDYGLTKYNDSYRDVIRFRKDCAMSLLNSYQDGSVHLLLSKHLLMDGSILNSTQISLEEWHLEGRSLGQGKHFLRFFHPFHITGHFRDSPLSIQLGAFIMRTNWKLSPTHYFRRPGIPSQSNITRGVAVENDRRTSFFVGDTRPQLLTGNRTLDFHGFWVTRFKGNRMSIQWSNRYFLLGEDWDLLIKAGGSCLGDYNGPGGNKGEGIAVVGSYSTQGSPPVQHTFVSMIDQGSGAEIWRTSCPSQLRFDEGIDIVYDPSQERYFLVGFVRDENENVRLYTAVVQNDGNFLGSTIHDPSPGNGFRFGDMMAKSVCLSLNKSHVVVTGYIEILGQGEPVLKTFATEMTVQPTPVATWLHFYQESEPDATGQRAFEAIKTLEGKSPKEAGYLIGTGGQLEGDTRDAQLIKIDVNGLLSESVGCKVVDFKLVPLAQDVEPPRFRFDRERYEWEKQKLPKAKRRKVPTLPCYK